MVQAREEITFKAFDNEVKPTWCAGCGDFGILKGFKDALVDLQLGAHEVMVVTGIGCGSKLPDYMRINAYLGIHGRTLPIAMGARLGNHDLKVVCITGDGDGYGIGGNHFLHALRRNPDITFIVQNNMVYGLTKGQYSPTSPQGFVASTTPDGSIEWQFNPMTIALAGGATFIARAFSGDPKHMSEVIAKGIQHKGFSVIDIFQPCVIYNRVNTYQWYRERLYKLEEEEGYDPSDRDAAWTKANEWGDRIPIGVFYQIEGLPTYEDQVKALEDGPLYKQPLDSGARNLEALKQEFM